MRRENTDSEPRITSRGGQEGNREFLSRKVPVPLVRQRGAIQEKRQHRSNESGTAPHRAGQKRGGEVV